MDIQNENAMIIEDNIFSSLSMEEYYYRCRISHVEKARAEYNRCINVLRKNSENILSDILDRREILEKLEYHYNNFNHLAEKIIEKRDINREEDFVQSMELLMCMVHETIIFISSKFGLLKSKNLRKKYDFTDCSFRNNESNNSNESNKEKLYYIINHIVNVQYYLNPDDPVNIIPDKFIIPISAICFVICSLAIMVVIVVILGLLSTIIPLSAEVISIISLFASLFFSIIVLCKFMNSAKYNLAERRSRAYSQTYNFVVHPYKNNTKIKISKILKWVKELSSFINSFKE